MKLRKNIFIKAKSKLLMQSGAFAASVTKTVKANFRKELKTSAERRIEFQGKRKINLVRRG